MTTLPRSPSRVRRCEMCAGRTDRHTRHAMATSERCVTLDPECWVELCDECTVIFDRMDLPIDEKKLKEWLLEKDPAPRSTH